MRKIYALVDCNNFFVSCERIFRPDLEGRPVVVLSSNDGCAVARSNEAKALGIPMGAPAFKYRDLFKQHGVVQFSANFELYADISRRITQLLTEFTPRTEIYSIDESFLDLSDLADKNYALQMQMLRRRIWHQVGMPVSIGIAPSKTLAKLASELAKKNPDLDGVLDLTSMTEQELSSIRTLLPVQDVWGVGWRSAPRLRALGIGTAQDLALISPRQARQILGGVKGEQTVRELQGQSCLALQKMDVVPKSIARTRTFGEDTDQLYVLEAAVASFTAQAAHRLRVSGQLTRRASLFLMTNRHKPNLMVWNREAVFRVPTADTGLIIQTLVGLLNEVYQPGAWYHRAGVWLHDFTTEKFLQTDLFGNLSIRQDNRTKNRMRSIDGINARFGRRTVWFAAEDLAKTWQPRRKLRSPHYTSEWCDLPYVESL